MTEGKADFPELGPPIESGPWRGWSKWTGPEPFEDYAGPFYGRRKADGSVNTAFCLEKKNLNAAGAAHGGALMTFADYSLFIIAIDEILGLDCVTTNLSAEFVGNAGEGSILTGSGEVIKAGRSLIFVRGLIDHEGAPVLSFSGTIKILRPRIST